jgi:hypothetical protein
MRMEIAELCPTSSGRRRSVGEDDGLTCMDVARTQEEAGLHSHTPRPAAHHVNGATTLTGMTLSRELD